MPLEASRVAAPEASLWLRISVAMPSYYQAYRTLQPLLSAINSWTAVEKPDTLYLTANKEPTRGTTPIP